MKEVKKESGFDVLPMRLLPILDKKFHVHPPEASHVYKMFTLCDIVGGEQTAGIETTSEVAFFAENQLPEISAERITEKKIKKLLEIWKSNARETLFD